VAALSVTAWIGPPLVRNGNARSTASQLTVTEFYRRVERAITRPGSVYRQVGRFRYVDDAGGHPRGLEAWVDTERELGRQQQRSPTFARLISDGTS
jgi:hypothetical protein